MGGQVLDPIREFQHLKTAVVLVDHGSRLESSNRLLQDVVEALRKKALLPIVEPAHMELAEPTVATAFARCAEQGAELVVVFPYFLGPGRHVSEDIPKLAAEAAAEHPAVRYLVADPLGLHPLLLQVIEERVADCLRSA